MDNDYGDYILHLKEPGDGSTMGAFISVVDEQNDEVTWELTNNGDVILFYTPFGVEEFLVESVSRSQLILILHRESNKPGADMIGFVFDK